MFSRHAFAFVAALACATLGAGPAFANDAPSAAAPADEYFGPLHMSVLGIRNALRMATERERADAGVDAFEAIATVERSVHDWERSYPHDPWLARSILALRTAYRASTSAAALARVGAVGAWLVARYPASIEADIVRSEEAPPVRPAFANPVEALYVPLAATCPSYATCR